MDADGHRPFGEGSIRIGGQGQCRQLRVGQRLAGIHTLSVIAGQLPSRTMASHDRQIAGGGEDGRGRGRERAACGVRAGSGSGRRRSEPESTRVVPGPRQPDDQSYWDGENWTAQKAVDARQGWIVAGDAPRRGGRCEPAAPARPSVRQSLRPGGGCARSKSTGFTLQPGVLLLLVCGIALMYGSVGAWVHVSGSVGHRQLPRIGQRHRPGDPTLIGVNGWVTFIGGILVVIFACFAMTSEELQLAILTTVIAAVTAVFAVYDMFRIVQKISQVPASLSPTSASAGA